MEDWMSDGKEPEASRLPKDLEAHLSEGEREFLAQKDLVEKNFYSQLERLRAEMPAAAQDELDEAERLFRAETDHATKAFFEELEQVRAIEIGR
jgi:hypothetical protein